MTRFWPEGLAVAVGCDCHATPEMIIWQQQPHEVHRVLQRWRIDAGWWQGRVWRDYYLVVTESGMLLELFRDLCTDRWYIQRVYD